MTTLKQVAEKYELTVEGVQIMKRGMQQCWDGIANDWLAGFESESEAYEAFDNDEGAMVAEATLDADYITMYGGKEYNIWAAEALKGRSDVLKLGRDVWNARSK